MKNAMSSTCLARCGSAAAHPTSALPVLAHANGLFISAPGTLRLASTCIAGAGIEPLPVPGDELRLVVEEVALAGAAGHEKLDNSPGLGRVMQHRGGIALHQRRKRNAAYPGAESSDKITAG